MDKDIFQGLFIYLFIESLIEKSTTCYFDNLYCF